MSNDAWLDGQGSEAPPAEGGNRLEWHDLPQYLRDEITRRAGSPIVAATSQPGGFSPGLASRLATESGARLFVKAISAAQNPSGPEIARREAHFSRALQGVSGVPRLLWLHDDGVWVALAFEDIEGRQPLQPWEPDELRLVLDAIMALSSALTPSPVDAVAIAESNRDEFMTWRRWEMQSPDVDIQAIDPGLPAALSVLARLESDWEGAATGTTLLHSDLRADNILLTDDGVKFVDWPGAQIGAAWVDPLLMLPSAAMHGTDVQAIVEEHPVFSGVGRHSIDALLAGVAGYFIGKSVEPPPIGLPTVRAFQLAQGRATLRWLRLRAAI